MSPVKNTQTTSVRRAGLAYKVGVGVIAAGIAITATSGLLGGVVFGLLMRILTLMGAPEDRDFLSPDFPEAGSQILVLLGTLVIMCGVWIFSLRLVIELLGLDPRPALTGRLSQRKKWGLGVAAAGLIVIVSAAVPGELIYETSRSGDYPSALTIIRTVGGLMVLGALFILIPGPFKRVVGWADRVGWGKMGCGWINKLGIGLIVLGLFVALLGFVDGPPAIIAAAGAGILLVGIVPHVIAGGRP